VPAKEVPTKEVPEEDSEEDEKDEEAPAEEHGSGCPKHSTIDADENCACDDGFEPADGGTKCVPTHGKDRKEKKRKDRKEKKRKDRKGKKHKDRKEKKNKDRKEKKTKEDEGSEYDHTATPHRGGNKGRGPTRKKGRRGLLDQFTGLFTKLWKETDGEDEDLWKEIDDDDEDEDGGMFSKLLSDWL